MAEIDNLTGDDHEPLPEFDQDDEEDGYIGKCWCGEERAWFSFSGLDETCGGLRILHCYCGGDFCVCHNHGETECDGCEDCEPDEDDYEEWPDDEY